MDSLRQRFDAVKPLYYVDHKRPSDSSITRVSEHFGLVLPSDLVQLAKHSKYYAAHFLSIGSDYSSPLHIIRANSYWRRRRPKRRIPKNLVILNIGYDDNYWCLDLSSQNKNGEYAIQFWCPEEISWFGAKPVLWYPSFREYVEDHIK